MVLELPALLCTFENPTKRSKISFDILYTKFKNFYKDELPKTLLTTHFTTQQRRYPGEHNILTTPTPFHKRHRTTLKLNLRL